MNVTETLRDEAILRPHQPAIVADSASGGNSITFAELDAAAGRLGGELRRLGVRRGDHVLVVQPMSIELYAVLVAVARLGAVAVFPDPSALKQSLRACCIETRPKAFIGSPKAHVLRFSTAIRRIPIKIAIGSSVPGAATWTLQQEGDAFDDIVPVDASAPALVTCTSGSTGVPKLALRTHGFLETQLQVLARNFTAAAEGVHITAMPVFVLANLAGGVTSVLPDADLSHPAKVDPRAIATSILSKRATALTASPTLLENLAMHCEARSLTLPSLQRLFVGGAPVFPRLLRRLEEVAPNADVHVVYGSTEAEPIAHISRSQMSDEDITTSAHGGGLLVGTPVPEISLAILDSVPQFRFTNAEFSRHHVAPGCIGEIVVTGEHVLKGYLGGRGDEENKIHVGGQVWHRTGDSGYIDGSGRLWLLGRSSAVIRDDRGVVYPFAVEAPLSENPAVRRGTVVSRSGKRTLVLECARKEAVREFTGAPHSITSTPIDEIRIVDRIPLDRRHNAKVDYPGLSRELARRRGSTRGRLR